MSGLFTNFRAIPAIGIGSNLPVGNSAALIINDGNTSVIKLATTSTTNSVGRGFDLVANGNNAFVENRESGNLSFGTNAGTRLVCSSNGNILIGTLTDNGTDKLQINGSIKSDLAADSTVLSVSQNAGTRSFSFGNNGFICNTVATLGRNTRGGGALLEINTASAGLVGILTQAVSGQTADLQQWRDSNNNILTRIDNLGRITAPQFRLSALNTSPASATDTGITGEIRIDTNFIYVCIATNTWRRANLSTW